MHDKNLRYSSTDILGKDSEYYLKLTGLSTEPYSVGIHAFQLYVTPYIFKAGSKIQFELIDSDDKPIKVYTVQDSQSYSPSITIGFQIEPDYSETSSMFINNGLELANFGTKDGRAYFTAIGVTKKNKKVKLNKEFYIKKEYVNVDKIRFSHIPTVNDINISLINYDFEQEQVLCEVSIANVSLHAGYIDAIKIMGKFNDESNLSFQEIIHYKLISVPTNGINNSIITFRFRLPLQLLSTYYNLRFIFYNPLEEPARDSNGNVLVVEKDFDLTSQFFDPIEENYLENYNLQVSLVGTDTIHLTWNSESLEKNGGGYQKKWRNVYSQHLTINDDALSLDSYVYALGFSNTESYVQMKSGSSEYHLFSDSPQNFSGYNTNLYNTYKLNTNAQYESNLKLSKCRWVLWLDHIENVVEYDINYDNLRNYFYSKFGFYPNAYKFLVYSKNPSASFYIPQEQNEDGTPPF